MPAQLTGLDDWPADVWQKYVEADIPLQRAGSPLTGPVSGPDRSILGKV